MTKQEFKQWLLSKGAFIDNDYLDQYVQLIFDYDKVTAGYREFHHSLPVLLSLSDGNICSVLNGRAKNTKGYTFIKVSKEDYYNEKRTNQN
jgi:hypothetical protein